ncbi:MAG: hypothetical protein U0183_13710 [Polyangiaceae bacterium]
MWVRRGLAALAACLVDLEIPADAGTEELRDPARARGPEGLVGA